MNEQSEMEQSNLSDKWQPGWALVKRSRRNFQTTYEFSGCLMFCSICVICSDKSPPGIAPKTRAASEHESS